MALSKTHLKLLLGLTVTNAALIGLSSEPAEARFSGCEPEGTYSCKCLYYQGESWCALSAISGNQCYTDEECA